MRRTILMDGHPGGGHDVPNDKEKSAPTQKVDSGRLGYTSTEQKQSGRLSKDHEASKDHEDSKDPRARFHNRLAQTSRLARILLKARFPTLMTALPRLPFTLIPFAFSQFILIEGLEHQGWITIFARWLNSASNGGQMHPTIWLVGVLGVILCNLAGTNIGATILLTKVMRAAGLSDATSRAGAISLAVASNVGAVSFTFSASLAGLLWKTILEQKETFMDQRTFAKWNSIPIFVMTTVGLAVVSIEMAILYRK